MLNQARKVYRFAKTEWTIRFGKTQRAEFLRQVRQHEGALPALDPELQTIAKAIKRDGIYVCHLNDLHLDGGATLVSQARQLDQHYGKVMGMGRYFDLMANVTERIHDKVFVALDSSLYLFGLQDKLLALAENVIGITPAYLGCEMRHDFNAGDQGPRNYHCDFENQRLLKICVYLNDVSEDDLTFEYIPFTERIPRGPGTFESRVGARSKICTGRAGTIIFALTSDMMHRGRVGANADAERYSMWFCYGTRYVIDMETCMALTCQESRMRLSQHLSQRQTDCVYWFRELLPSGIL